MLGWIAWGNLREDTQPDRAFSTLGSASEAERVAASRLLQAGYSVLRSPAFRTHLEALQGSYPVIYARPSEQEIDPRGVAAVIALERLGSRFAPAQVTIVDDNGEALGMAGEGGTSGRYSDVLITRGVLGIFGSSDVVARSCAINVAAHEYAHTISLTPVGYRVAFSDTNEVRRAIADRRHPGTPVASYLIGAVAQCTWLETQGRIGPDDVRACVEVFGTAGFNWRRCGQFTGGEPVALRPGLAPAVPPL
jgi:hypothetical protein